MIAALRQLWEIATRLPPGAIIALLGLLLMGGSILLLLAGPRLVSPKEHR